MGRWTLAGMMGLIVVVAAGLAAVRESSPAWAAVVSYLVAASFVLVATIALLRKSRRPWWIGFTTFGGGYLILAVALGPTIGPLPGIGRVVDSISDRLDPPPPSMSGLWLPRERWMQLPLEERIARAARLTQESERDRVYTRDLRTRRESSAVILHSLFSVAIGMMGAGLASIATRTRRRRAGPDATVPEPEDGPTEARPDQIARK